MSVANRLRPKRPGKKKDPGLSAAGPSSSSASKGLPPFVTKLYAMVEDPTTEHVISWGPSQETFIVHRPEELASEVLPLYFKHNNYCSFIRQVNTYGFNKVSDTSWEFMNENFKKGWANISSFFASFRCVPFFFLTHFFLSVRICC